VKRQVRNSAREPLLLRPSKLNTLRALNRVRSSLTYLRLRLLTLLQRLGQPLWHRPGLPHHQRRFTPPLRLHGLSS
jgi:hypothetical protein